jgi:hypothetical protein
VTNQNSIEATGTHSKEKPITNYKEESCGAKAAKSVMEAAVMTLDTRRNPPMEVFPHMAKLNNGHASSRIVAVPYHWPCTATMDLKNTALVIIDMQNDCKCYIAIIRRLHRQLARPH